jgi:hypothetical protein
MSIEEKRLAFIEYQKKFYSQKNMYDMIEQSDQNNSIINGGYDNIIDSKFEVILVKKELK